MCAWCSAGTAGSPPSARSPSHCTCKNTACTGKQPKSADTPCNQSINQSNMHAAAPGLLIVEPARPRHHCNIRRYRDYNICLSVSFNLHKGVRTTANRQLEWPGESASSWLQCSPLQGSRCFFQLLFQAHHGLCLAPLYNVCEGLRVTPRLGNSAAGNRNWFVPGSSPAAP